MRRPAIALLALAACAAPPLPEGTLAVTDLACAHAIDPLGLDDPAPSLAWRLVSERRETAQVAYRIVVTSEDGVDAWDTGRVESGRSFAIAYGGRPLRSREECRWRVCVWDNHGRTAWGGPARWEMGLLRPADWSARWIALPGAAPPSLEGASWIWFPEGEPIRQAPLEDRFFRRAFDLAEAPRAARIVIAADNRYALFVNGVEVATGSAWERPDVHDIAPRLRAGRNVIAVVAANAGGPAGWIAQVDGIELRTDASWRCSTRREDGWEAPGFDDSGWAPAKELARHGAAPWGKTAAPDLGPRPVFRKAFRLARRARRARLYACGLGNVEMTINGAKVGEDVLEPGWTDYRKRCLYATYDVTELLRPGDNAIGAMLGNGMAHVTGGRYTKFTGTMSRPKLIAQLEAVLEDGARVTVATDGTWSAAPGPITFSCVYGGEDYDARREAPAWEPAAEVAGPGGALRARNFPPVRCRRILRPVAVSRPAEGVVLYDFGENAAGWPAIRVRGEAGARVKLVPGEILRGGRVFQAWSGGPSHWTYTLRGGDAELWTPRFSYSGFRWLEAHGVEPEEVEVHVLHASVPERGTFRCSDPRLNAIHELILRAIRSNMQSVFTDCPHREKFGWLEETHLMGPSILGTFDAAALYAKVIRDMGDAQVPNGMVPTTAPEYMDHSWAGEAFRDSPEWGSACVIVPWMLYERTGDRRFVEEGYDIAARYMGYLGSRAKGHILRHGLGDWADVGSAVAGHGVNTPVPLVATAIWFHDAALMARMARVLGRDAAPWESLAASIRDAFDREFRRGDAYATGSQACLAMPLALGLVPSERRDAVLRALVADVERRGHTTTGDVGHRFFLRALAEGGRSDLILRMARRTEHPSYGYQLAHGATTLTEAWDGPTAGASQNHFMLGHIEEWFFRDLAGLDVDCSRATPLGLRPQVPDGIDWAEASTWTPWGPFASRWERTERGVVVECRVPANARAEVRLPGSGSPSRLVGSGEWRFEIAR